LIDAGKLNVEAEPSILHRNKGRKQRASSTDQRGLDRNTGAELLASD
jgi:hypothetical protein